MKLLILYGTTEGHTRTISERLADFAREAGHDVTISDASREQPLPVAFDTVILAASLHAGRYQTSITHYATENSEALNDMTSVFVSVSLTAAVDEPESWQELQEHTSRFLAEAGWEPTFIEQVAGALLYSEYDFFKRFIMRLISKRAGVDTDTSRDYVYTDWQQVKEIIEQIGKEAA